jgi:biotin transport system substrate-specific component
MQTSHTIAAAAPRTFPATLLRDAGLVVSATIFMALCAHVSLPLLFTPVPLTLQTFALPVIALLLGPRRGATAMALYLMEGASGLPVFSPAGPGGIAQLLGPTGGYLMTYPLVAFVIGELYERFGRTFGAAAIACSAGIAIVFIGAVSWLMVVTGRPLFTVLQLAVLPYIAGEVLKIAAASIIVTRWNLRKN